ncbi:hypothetical protein [Bacillus thuringiensis]|uniref:hypothetical protein n=1 Tax=Bacillus thuringiensis TaxID=1428 RepID=UPI000BED9474|nr:hypothetical protein [Bacillus thuringiensis]PDZ61389.1 hypothetical protein CON29_19550 [Bacillus thuringiensis]
MSLIEQKILGINLENLDREDPKQRMEISRRKAVWTILSFQKVFPLYKELQDAQTTTNVILTGTIYRFVAYRKGERSIPDDDFRKVRFKVEDKVTLFTDGVNILFKCRNTNWNAEDVNKL